MPTNTVYGDLITLAENGHFDVIVHGCNCFCTMGAGIAKQIKMMYPEAYEADLRTLRGDMRKLGTYSCANVKCERTGINFTIVNAYTQFRYGKGNHADELAIDAVFKAIANDFHPHSRIAYPKIGAGLAGGDWERISRIINYSLAGRIHTLVIFERR